MASTTFGELKRDLLALLGALEREGTASGGTSSTLVDSGVLTDQDDYFIGKRVYVRDGTAQGDEREITDSSSTSANVTVSPNFSATPDGTSKYYIYDTFRNSQIEQALKTAMRLLRPSQLIPLETTDEDTDFDLGDPSLAATYSISAPTNMVAIRSILREDGTEDGVYDMAIPGPHQTKNPWWVPKLTGTTYKILLDYAIAQFNGWIEEGRNLKIIGYQYQAEPANDDSTITVPTGPILWLAQNLIDVPGVGVENARERTRRARAIADYLNDQVVEMWSDVTVLEKP